MKKLSGIFTLIELLTVIAVISILLCLLLTSLKQVRETAKSISCVNNIKQVFITEMNYTSDFNDYIGVHPVLGNLINFYGEQKIPYKCPGDPSTNHSTLSVRLSYAINYSFVTTTGVPQPPPVKIIWVKKPSKCPLFAETKPFSGTAYYDPDGTQSGSRGYVYGATGINYDCSGRHKWGSNYVCSDGNAAWMLQRDLNVTSGSLFWRYYQ